MQGPVGSGAERWGAPGTGSAQSDYGGWPRLRTPDAPDRSRPPVPGAVALLVSYLRPPTSRLRRRPPVVLAGWVSPRSRRPPAKAGCVRMPPEPPTSGGGWLGAYASGAADHRQWPPDPEKRPGAPGRDTASSCRRHPRRREAPPGPRSRRWCRLTGPRHHAVTLCLSCPRRRRGRPTRDRTSPVTVRVGRRSPQTGGTSAGHDRSEEPLMCCLVQHKRAPNGTARTRPPPQLTAVALRPNHHAR